MYTIDSLSGDILSVTVQLTEWYIRNVATVSLYKVSAPSNTPNARPTKCKLPVIRTWVFTSLPIFLLASKLSFLT